MALSLSGSIAFASGKTGDYDVWTCDLESAALTQLTFGTGWNDKPSFSPDGEWVVFVSDRTGDREIFKAPAAGGEAIQLTSLNGRWADSPAFSPDGKRIAYVSNSSGDNDLWIMNADGSNPLQVTTDSGSDETVAWTPDGQGLLWSSDRGDDADIWHFDFASEVRTQLNEDRGQDHSPAPSPDGSLIAFVSNRQENPDPANPYSDRDKDLWLMTGQGELAVKLTENQGADFAPCWSPCGSYLLYTASDRGADCSLSVLDVTEVVASYPSGDLKAIEKAASRLRAKSVSLDREPLKAEIGAKRNSFLLSALLPESWVSSCYPAGYFGLERNPTWTAARIASHATPSTAAGGHSGR